jgi:hypothetical protein
VTESIAPDRRSAEPLIAVLVPLEDTRGDVTDHLRTWTHGQTLPRDRFQVIVATAGAHGEDERRLRRLLAPQDAVVHTPGAGLVDLWNAAAARADAPWLVLTEAHCLGDSRCLEAVAEAIARDPNLDAASMRHGHRADTRAGDLCARWFQDVYNTWDGESWRHLNFVGVAVRRAAFDSVGGLDPELGLFCAPLFSARLHELGARVGHVDDAVVVHVHNDSLADHHGYSVDYAEGEMRVRASHDEAFCERYFGHDWTWTNRLAYRPEIARRFARDLVDALGRAVLRRRDDASWLARELFRVLPAALAGARLHAAVERLRFRVDALWAERAPRSEATRYARFLRAQDEVVRSTRLRWIRDRVGRLDAPRARAGRVTVDELTDAGIVGGHALERDGRRFFRWTEPVALLRVAGSPGQELVLDTRGLRGPPLSYVTEAYVDGRRVARRLLDGDDRHLRIPLGQGTRARGPGGGVTILSRPFDPGAWDVHDPRRLGLPLFSVEVREIR